MSSALRTDYATDQFDARDLVRLLRSVHVAMEGLKQDLDGCRRTDRRYGEIIHFLDVSQAIVEEIMADHLT